ncbi:MAG: ROK family protein [Ruminococcaceae bacterium]|nr:ROK family protein [Oscillospiraceae bacterium]
MKKDVIFACDIGGSKLLCGFIDEKGSIIDKEKLIFPLEFTEETIESYILELYTLLKERNPECKAVSCGMTIPGLADPKNGIWVYACFSGISNFPIAERMSEKLGLSVYIENDVNACAYAESVFGICKDCSDYLWVTVSNGVGGGLVLNGQVYSGAFGGAGEIGHIIVEDNGPLCPCGHKGCVEGVAAGPAISRRYEAVTGENISALEISKRARNGEKLAVEVFKKTGEYIGKGLGSAASLLNLRRYVLGGGVMQSFDLMEEDIHKAFRNEAFSSPNKNAEIVLTALKYEAGLLGAASLAINK